MPVSTSGAALTERHRRDQTAIRTAFTTDFLTAWSLLNVFRLDATTAAWLALVEQLVAGWRRTSAQTTAGFYERHRAIELAALHVDRAPALAPVLGDRPDRAALRTSLLVTGPVTIKRLSGQGVPVPEAARTAAVRAEAAAARHVLDGGRATMRATVANDPVALGWARVTDADPCWLCAMAASRGPVYKTRDAALFIDGTGGQPWHDGCGCTAEPVYSRRADWPGDGRKWERLWAEATAGLSGDDARRAFRRAVDAQRGIGSGSGAGRGTGGSGTGTRRAEARAEPEARVDAEATRQPSVSEAEPPRVAGSVPPEAPRVVEPVPAESERADPLAGIDLAELSEDELLDLFSELSAAEVPHESALRRLDVEMARREEAAPKAPQPEPEPVDPLDGVDLAAATDDELYALWNRHADRSDVVARVTAELARRRTRRTDAAEAFDFGAEEDTEEQRRIDQLVARGWGYLDAYAEVYGHDPAELDRQQRVAAIDVDRQKGETREQTVRRLYDEWVREQLVEAENATRGNLLTRAGHAAGIDPVTLFSGPAARARKWASEDLKRWWADASPRLTYTEFKAAILGRQADKQAAELIARRGNDRDFGL